MVAKAKFRIEGEDASGAAWRSVMGQAQKTSKAMSSAFTAAFAGISVGSVVSLGREAIEMGDNLEKARVRAHATAEEISSLAYAAKLSDIDLDSLTMALQKMQINLVKASMGSKDQADTLRAIGLSWQELKSLKPAEQMELIADHIVRLKDEEEQALAVTNLFGKAGGDLLPFFQQGAAGIRKAREEAEQMGAVFNQEQLTRLSNADEAIKKMDASWHALWITLVSKVAPVMTDIMNNTMQMGDASKFPAGFPFVPAAPGTFSDAPNAANEGHFKGRSNGDERLGPLAGAGPGLAAIAAGDEAKKQAQKNADAIDAIWKSWAQEQYENQKEVAEATQKQWAETEDLISSGMDNLGNELADLHIEDPMIESAEMIKGAFLNAFDDMVNTGKLKVGELLKYIAAEFTRRSFASLLDQAFGIDSASGSTGFLTSLFTGSLNSGDSTAAWVDDFKADGGPVMAGKTYVVGERGAELFRPSTNGSITPNGAMGGSVVINAPLTINGANSIDAATANRISAEHARRLMDELDRRNMTRAAA